MAQSKTSPRAIKATLSRKTAVDMRLRGHSYGAIGEHLNISKQAANSHVLKALNETLTQCAEDAEHLRAIEVARLDDLQEKFTKLLENCTLLDDVDGAKKVADILIKVAERRSKLLGLDAPTKSEVSGKDGQPLVAGVFAIPQSQPSVDAWAQSAQQSVAPLPAPELPAPPQT